ncbi:hypothetical protein D4764_03G0011060 [Takifugu flavidus]|uniref:Uncharacterized protein n=1 Tax=Takifugu flavidus TaxID=433684 RepID=A0A5C6NB49_9TELE|nr:hypothetical protein D4764_03G0011060 [Takifugu flavidus]
MDFLESGKPDVGGGFLMSQPDVADPCHSTEKSVDVGIHLCQVNPLGASLSRPPQPAVTPRTFGSRPRFMTQTAESPLHTYEKGQAPKRMKDDDGL